MPDLLDRCIQVHLPTPGDKNVSSLGDEALGRGQSDAAIAAGDQRDFTGEFAVDVRSG